jgi:hypothetical protein
MHEGAMPHFHISLSMLPSYMPPVLRGGPVASEAAQRRDTLVLSRLRLRESLLPFA